MSNFNFNKVILGGRLTADPELKQTPNGVPVVSFSIAINRRFQSKENAQQQTDFFNVTAWRSTAETISKYFHKGSTICIVGSIQNRTWTDTNGQKRYATDIIAEEVQFVDSKGEAESEPKSNGSNYVPAAYSEPQREKFESVSNDDDLPF